MLSRTLDFALKVVFGFVAVVFSLWFLSIAFSLLAYFGLAILALSFFIVSMFYWVGSYFVEDLYHNRKGSKILTFLFKWKKDETSPAR